MLLGVCIHTGLNPEKAISGEDWVGIGCMDLGTCEY